MASRFPSSSEVNSNDPRDSIWQRFQLLAKQSPRGNIQWSHSTSFIKNSQECAATSPTHIPRLQTWLYFLNNICILFSFSSLANIAVSMRVFTLRMKWNDSVIFRRTTWKIFRRQRIVTNFDAPKYLQLSAGRANKRRVKRAGRKIGNISSHKAVKKKVNSSQWHNKIKAFRWKGPRFWLSREWMGFHFSPHPTHVTNSHLTQNRFLFLSFLIMIQSHPRSPAKWLFSKSRQKEKPNSSDLSFFKA